MTKREKYPPLKPWQKEVVKKHETRNRLSNGTPFDRAKYRFMKRNDISEEMFESDVRRFEKTLDFQSLLLHKKLFAAFAGAAEAIRRVLNGR